MLRLAVQPRHPSPPEARAQLSPHELTPRGAGAGSRVERIDKYFPNAKGVVKFSTPMAHLITAGKRVPPHPPIPAADTA